VTADDLVQELATSRRLDAIRALVGGVNARELRAVVVDAEVFDAIVAGLRDPNPKIRWWCLQLLDHVDDERAIAAIAECLDDPVPRVRRNAAHALGCAACKPGWDGTLPDGVAARLLEMATSDENAKVRATAAQTMTCTVERRAERRRA
jgi:HEAT repeat protein